MANLVQSTAMSHKGGRAAEASPPGGEPQKHTDTVVVDTATDKHGFPQWWPLCPDGKPITNTYRLLDGYGGENMYPQQRHRYEPQIEAGRSAPRFGCAGAAFVVSVSFGQGVVAQLRYQKPRLSWEI